MKKIKENFQKEWGSIPESAKKMLDKKEKINEKMLLGWHEEIFGMTKSDIAGR